MNPAAETRSEPKTPHGPPRRRWRGVAARFTLGAAAICAGCVSPQRAFQPDRDPAALDDVSFLHYLATVPVVTVDEGMRAMLLLKGVSLRRPTFERQFEMLHRIRAVRRTWRLSSGQVLDKGTLAYMLAELCGLRRSLDERIAWVTGLGDRRYALKTCVHEGLLPYGLAHEPVSGGELLTSLTEADRFLGLEADKRP